jgi:uncharacterized membrane protein
MRFVLILVALAALVFASPRPAVAQSYTVLDLGTRGGDSSEASAIGNRGEVAGYKTAAGRTDGLVSRADAMADLGTLAAGTHPAVNDKGQIVGERDGRALLWENGETRDLGMLPGDRSSLARSINTSAQIVGESVGVDGVSRAVLWQAGSLSDLNTRIPTGSGWVLTSASAIDDAGQIAGTGLHNGQPRAFLLTPVKRAPVAPASLILR